MEIWILSKNTLCHFAFSVHRHASWGSTLFFCSYNNNSHKLVHFLWTFEWPLDWGDSEVTAQLSNEVYSWTLCRRNTRVKSLCGIVACPESFEELSFYLWVVRNWAQLISPNGSSNWLTTVQPSSIDQLQPTQSAQLNCYNDRRMFQLSWTTTPMFMSLMNAFRYWLSNLSTNDPLYEVIKQNSLSYSRKHSTGIDCFGDISILSVNMTEIRWEFSS